MSADTIAIVSLVLTAIGAIAACIAAYFSWKAPSKIDLARVERHTAETSHHLKQQAHREELTEKAEAVPMVVTGENHLTEPLILLFTLHEMHIGVKLIRIGLYNEKDSLFGIVQCNETSYAHQYEAEIPADMFKAWFYGGRSVSPLDVWLRLRVYMNIDGHDAYRKMPIKAHRGLFIRGNTSMQVNQVEGTV